MQLKQTWRWFGPDDPVSLHDVLQAGAQGVVTALHHVPHGEVWTIEEIQKRQEQLIKYNLTWDVVESVTIHESIKTRTGSFQHYINNFKQTLQNIAACGIPVVTYNFMPVNDWARTDLNYSMPDGSKALYFSWYDMAVFDVHILKREGAAHSYSEEILREAENRFKNYSQQEQDELAAIIMFGIPGEQKQTLEGMRNNLTAYKNITHQDLQRNLILFLQEIIPVAENTGLRMAIHPDDPPYPILGLPRVVSTWEDLEYILNAVESPANGLCFCTGSLGAHPKNDLPSIAKKAGTRINFVHLRNVKKDEAGNFFEDDHLAGDVDMYAVMTELLFIQQQVANPIPFRPDHGHQMMDDLHKKTNPGYSAIGRMRGLAELRGLQLGVYKSFFEK